VNDLEITYNPTYDNAGYFGALHEFQRAVYSRSLVSGGALALQKTGQLYEAGSKSAELCATLLAEETGELIEALGQKPAHEALKEVVDVIYVAVRIAAIYGWQLEEAFARVHENNMLKIKTGTIRKDGKLVKASDHPKVSLKDCV